MSNQNPKKKFLEKFHDLVKYYEQMHEDHEYKGTRTAVKTFYTNFLAKFDEVFNPVINPRIKERSVSLRNKAEELAKFNENVPLHDLAETMVERLNDLGMELYSMPDLDYVMESTPKVELNVLMACCPEFTTEKGKGAQKGTQKLCCNDIKTIKVGLDQDIQAAVRLYYERYCRDCQKLDAIKKKLLAAK
nr:hypothetical protein [Candidatus Sigynarchaeota archaeon]